jgi:squalene-associated FAD-dependent desaturase
VTGPARRAFVLGGGVAGLVAAFGLADRGFHVQLLESRPWCGGRAFSFVDKENGRRLDNGPHAMLGCYRAMRALLRRLDTERLFVGDRTLRMAYRTADGRTDRLLLGSLPVPLAMPAALFGLRVPFGARLRALWGMASVTLGAPATATFGDWLRRRRQHGAPDGYLWRPLCRAVMNAEPDAISAGDFLATLREAFFGRAGSAAFWLPTRPWGEILADPAPAALARAGVQLRTGARVTSMERADDRIVALGLGNGERLPIGAEDLVVSALPWFALRTLGPDTGLPMGALQSSPIVTAHFRLADDAALLPDEGPVVALVDGDPFHFVLRTPGGDPRAFAVLSGGNRAFDGMQVGAIEDLARTQLARHYPGFPHSAPAHVRISKENLAAFVAAPGSRALRPQPGRLPNGPRNLLVCGDWTDTGLPATLEGAARSAERLLAGVR